MSPWTTDDIPDQTGRHAVITGATSGLGLLSARALAEKGAEVTLAVRDLEAGRRVAAELGPRIRAEHLDLSSLASVREFAALLSSTAAPIDLLVNNAGTMNGPRRVTSDGYELQFATNHLGHFALTVLLAGRLDAADSARVVTVSSTEHKLGSIWFDDINLEQHYRPRRAYQQSKLANTLFAIELDRRLRARGSATLSVLAHPGQSATNLTVSGPTGLDKFILSLLTSTGAQPASEGVLPQLYAATAEGVEGGQFFGPSGRGERSGSVTLVQPSAAARDALLAQRLWQLSVEMTGADLPPGTAADQR